MTILYMLVFIININNKDIVDVHYFNNEIECYSVLHYLQDKFNTTEGTCNMIKVNTA